MTIWIVSGIGVVVLAFIIWLAYSTEQNRKAQEAWNKATRIVIIHKNRHYEANLLEYNKESQLAKVRLTYETGYYWDVRNPDGSKYIKREEVTEEYWISQDKILIWPKKEENAKS